MARPHRIWVVDDDPEIRQLLSTYLSDQGYEVRCLAGGEQLRARLENQRPDLLVLDLMLPGDDGLTLLRRLREKVEEEAANPCHLITVWGVGYRWEP